MGPFGLTAVRSCDERAVEAVPTMACRSGLGAANFGHRSQHTTWQHNGGVQLGRRQRRDWRCRDVGRRRCSNRGLRPRGSGRHIVAHKAQRAGGRGAECAVQQQLLPPGIELAAGDAVPARHRRRRRARFHALSHDLPLLLSRPATAPLAPGSQLGALGASAHMITRRSVAYVRSPVHHPVVLRQGRHLAPNAPRRAMWCRRPAYADDGGDMRLPFAAGQRFGGIEDGDGAFLVTATSLVVAADLAERSGRGADVLDLLMQGGLVVLDLHDQGGVGGGAGLEGLLLAMQGVEGDHGSGNAEGGENSLRGRDLVGFLVDIEVGEHQGGLGGEHAEDLCGEAVSEVVEAAAQGLAVNGETNLAALRAGGLQQGGVAAESRFQRVAIEPFQDIADGGVRRCAEPIEVESAVQLFAVDIYEGDDATVRIGAADNGEDGEQQHMLQLVELALCPARIGNVCQQVQQRRECGHGNLQIGCRSMSQTFSGSGIPFLSSRFTLTRRCCIQDSRRAWRKR